MIAAIGDASEKLSEVVHGIATGDGMRCIGNDGERLGLQ